MGKRDQTTLDELTDEEREAIEEADGEEGAEGSALEDEIEEAVAEATGQKRDPETGQFVKTKAEDDEEAAADDDTKSGVDEGETETEATASADTEADDADKATDEEPAARPYHPTSERPVDADTKLADIAKRRDDLAEQFDNGDLTAKEFQAKLTELDDEKFEVKMAIQRADMAEEVRKDNWFNKVVPDFLDTHPHYKPTEDGETTLSDALDTTVRRLQVAAIEKGQDPMSPDILARADRSIRKAFAGLLGQAAEEAEAEADPKKASATEKAKAAVKAAGPRKAPPTTLATVPAADGEATDGGAFASLDRLMESDPEAFEDAVARLPSHERERYLAQQ